MSRKKVIYVGIYSNAWETTARTEAEDGTLIGTALIPEPINIHLSIKHAWETIKNIISMSLNKANITLYDPNIEINLGIGIKNTELVEACIELKKQNNLFKNFVLTTDGYVLLQGSHKNDGAIILLDDGVVGNAITSGRLTKIGGWGFPHADVGSISWLGLEAIRLTIQWLDDFIEESPLLVEIYSHFNNDISQLVKWAMYSRANPIEYSFICDIVLSCLNKKDKHSLMLISRTASEANRLYQKLLENSGAVSLPCSLHGRLVPYAKKFISDPLAENMTNPLGDGVSGALVLIREKTRINQIDDDVVTSIPKGNFKNIFTG